MPDEANETGRVVLAGHTYDVLRDWGRLPGTIPRAHVSQVAVDAKGRLHVLRRGVAPVVVFSPDGEFAFTYGEGQIFDSHGITIDHLDRVLIADRDAHQILVFDAEGGLQFALGERHHPHWDAPFNHPTQAAVAPSGDILVADGYGNARIHRFAPDGRHIMSFGAIGTGPGDFMTPHAVLVDHLDRIAVADRENDRIQLFDQNGRWLEERTGLCRPMDMTESKDGLLLVTDQVPSLTAFDGAGLRIGRCRPSLNGAHGIAGDEAGNFYLAESQPSGVTKMRRI